MTNVLIGIQARSTSSRLPGKSLELIEQITMTEHVRRACQSSIDYLNKNSKLNINANICILVPSGDQLVDHFGGNLIIEGNEDDVLSRYHKSYKKFFPEYLVRVTGDEPLLLPPLISKCIISAVKNNYDYTSNIYDECRTYIDGLDVEVISSKLLLWLSNNANTDYHKEHVTTRFRENPPKWAKIGTVIAHIDLSHIKLSVDTQKELDAVRANKRSIASKIMKARSLGHDVIRF